MQDEVIQNDDSANDHLCEQIVHAVDSKEFNNSEVKK